MPRRAEAYRFKDNDTPLNADEFNNRFFDVDSRISTLEQSRPSLDSAITDLANAGLARINAVLLPAFNKITQIESVGFLSAPIMAGSNAIFASGATAVTIDPAQKDVFIPPPWVVLARAANTADYCIAQTVSYNAVTGGLSLNVTSVHGTPGTYTDVIVEGAPGGALAAIDSAASVLAAQADVDAKAALVAAQEAQILIWYNQIQGTVLSGPVTSVDGLTGAVTGVEQTSHKAATNGYAGLDGNAQVPTAQLPAGRPNGVAGLDSGASVPVAQLPAAVVGCLNFQGGWNAATNMPALTPGVGTKGYYYKVTTGSSARPIDGNNFWTIGDWIVFNGAAWDRVAGAAAVTSVAGKMGNVVIAASDLSDIGAAGLAVAHAPDAPSARAAIGAARLGAVETINSQSGSYTLVASDIGAVIEMTSNLPSNLTVPPNAIVSFPVHTRIDIIQYGSGTVTVAAGAGVTLRSAGVRSQLSGRYMFASLLKRGTDEWYLYGAVG